MSIHLSEQQLVALCAGLVLGLLFLWLSLRMRARERLLRDLPTSKAKGVFIGLVEMKGAVECPSPLRSYLADSSVVYYTYSIEERWSRTVTESYTDSDGKTKTRTRHESGWKSVASDAQSTPFFLRDDTGAILVRPEGADIEPERIFEVECGRDDPLYYGRGPDFSVSDSDHRRRFVESAIEVGANLFVVGQARERSDLVAAEIARDPQAALFLISTRTEEKLRGGMAIWSWCFWLGLVLFGALAGWGFAPLCQAWLQVERPDIWSVVLGSMLFLVLWGLCWAWMAFNSLVALRQRVRQAWSLIEVQLKRRHDLIPRLVEVLSAQKSHEALLQETLARLRTQALATPPGKPGPDPAGLIPSIRAVVEAYPDLGAQEGFRRLHGELVDTEQRIALARGYYNDIATHFTTRLEQIPDAWLAKLVSMRPEPLLLAEDFERASLEVRF